MKFLCFIGSFLKEFMKFVKNIVTISFLFVITIFVLTVLMPQNMVKALEIFKNLW